MNSVSTFIKTYKSFINKFLAIIFVLFLFCVTSLSADVTITTKVNMSTFGSPETSILIKEFLSGMIYGYQIQELTTDEEVTSEQFVPSEAIIASIDNKTISLIDYNAGTYDEMPLSSFGEIMKLTRGEWPTDVVDQIEWSISFVNDIRDKINDFECLGIKINVNGVNKDDSLQKITVISEQWKTIDSSNSNEFDLLKQMLLDSAGTDLNPVNMIMEDMSYRYYPNFDSLALQFRNLNGFMIKSLMTIGIVSPPFNDKQENNRNRTIYDEAVEMMRYINQQTGRKNEDGMMTIFSLSSNVIDINFDKIDPGTLNIPEGFTKIVE